MERPAHVDAPELFHRIKSDHLFEQISPDFTLTEDLISCKFKYMTVTAYLPARRLGEPQCPLIHQRVLDVEVFGVVKDSDLLVSSLGSFRRRALFDRSIFIIATR